MRQSIIVFGILSLTGMIALSGCGGAGTIGNTSALNTPSLPGQNGSGVNRAADGSQAREAAPGGRIGVLLTDSPTTDYAHVWVTIHKIELLDNTEKAQTVFESTEGVTVDLTTLRDTTGARFALLGTAQVASGRPYGRARVTIGKSVNVLTEKTPVAQTLLIADSVARDTEGKPVLSFPLEHSRDMGTGNENLVVDFDLAHFTQQKDLLLPVLREGTHDNMATPTRQEPILFTGTVRDIAADNAGQTFTLASKENQTLKVLVAPTTILFNDDKKPSPTLAENKAVRVRGVYAPDTKRLVATQVEFIADDRANVAVLRGTVSTPPASSQSTEGGAPFAVDIRQAHGFVPTQNSVTVTLAPDAVLRSRSGLPMEAKDFSAALATPNTQIDLVGAYDAAQGTLTATRARLVNTTPTATHDATITGKLSVNKNGELLVGSATEWDGILAPAKKGAPITTTTATAYSNEKGAYLAGGTVRAAAEKGAYAKVSGIYGADGIFTATHIDLLPEKPSPIETAKTDAPKADIQKSDLPKNDAVKSDTKTDTLKTEDVKPGSKPEAIPAVPPAS